MFTNDICQLNYLTVTLICVLTTGLWWFIRFSSKQYYKRKKYANIPGPCSSFFLGNLTEIKQKILNDKLSYPNIVSDYFELYGSLFKIQLFNRIVVFTIDPETIQKALIVKNFPKEPKFCFKNAYPFKMRFLGEGILTECNHEIWKRQRVKFLPFFSQTEIE